MCPPYLFSAVLGMELREALCSPSGRHCWDTVLNTAVNLPGPFGADRGGYITAAEGKDPETLLGQGRLSCQRRVCKRDPLVRRMVLECSDRLEAVCLSFLPREQLGPQRWESTCRQASVTLRLYRLGVIVSILTSPCFTQHPGCERVLC